MYLNALSAAVWYPIRFDTVHDAVRSVAIWLTLALAAAFIVCALLLKGEKRAKFLKIALLTAVAYACAVCAVFLSFSFAEDGIETLLFVPLLLLLLAVAGSALAVTLRRTRPVFIGAGGAVGAALLATLVCMGVRFASGDSLESNGISRESVNSIALYLTAILLVAAVVALAFFFGRKDKKGFDTKSITYAAICIAMSFALSYLRIVKMPQGGSITLASLLPLMIYSYMFGTKKGVFAGMIYGLLQALQDTYILHPAQFVLDYPLAFAGIGLAGMFAKTKALEKLPQLQFALGAVVAGVARFLMHFLSGIFAFGAFAPEGTPVALYSLGYQAAYVFPDIVIAIAAGVLVFSSKSFVKAVKKFNASKDSAQAVTQTAAQTSGENVR